MNCVVLQGSRAMILTLPLLESPQLEPPRIDAVLLSMVRHSGLLEVVSIELEAEGIPQPFLGNTWYAEWMRVQRGWELHLALPDSLLSASFDPILRLGLEVVAKAHQGRTLTVAALDVDCLAPKMEGGEMFPSWAPDSVLI